MKKLLFIITLFSFPTWAQQAPGASKLLISVSLIPLASSTKQGGQGPQGSSLLTQSEIMYAGPNFGYGLAFQYDQQGTNEKDSGFGPKLEFYLGSFFIEAGYLLQVKRAFTDRTIAEQSGSGMFYGLGARFPISFGQGGGPGSKLFFQASYKSRTHTITKQDSTSLSDAIIQTDGYPLLGLGFSF